MSEQLELSVDGLAMAREWKRANPEAYEAIVGWALVDNAHGERASIDLYANLLRRPYFTRLLGLSRTDVVYRLNNNLRAELARLVMADHPRLRFEIRRSRADEPGVLNAAPRRP